MVREGRQEDFHFFLFSWFFPRGHLVFQFLYIVVLPSPIFLSSSFTYRVLEYGVKHKRNQE